MVKKSRVHRLNFEAAVQSVHGEAPKLAYKQCILTRNLRETLWDLEPLTKEITKEIAKWQPPTHLLRSP